MAQFMIVVSGQTLCSLNVLVESLVPALELFSHVTVVL